MTFLCELFVSDFVPRCQPQASRNQCGRFAKASWRIWCLRLRVRFFYVCFLGFAFQFVFKSFLVDFFGSSETFVRLFGGLVWSGKVLHPQPSPEIPICLAHESGPSAVVLLQLLGRGRTRSARLLKPFLKGMPVKPIFLTVSRRGYQCQRFF